MHEWPWVAVNQEAQRADTSWRLGLSWVYIYMYRVKAAIFSSVLARLRRFTDCLRARYAAGRYTAVCQRPGLVGDAVASRD